MGYSKNLSVKAMMMMIDEMENLKGQPVEVIYNTVLYHGTLTGASETELYLQTATDWLSLPLEGITQIKKAV